MDVSAYLSRINYQGSTEPNSAVLRELHRAHLSSAPFENLDISLKRPIRLDQASLFNKIVVRRRGGFCYELNGLLAMVLKELGYQVDLLNARGINDDRSYSREFDHLILRVRSPLEPDTHWLVDVGWGNGPLEPLRMEPDIDQVQGAGDDVFQRTFRISLNNNYYELKERGEDGGWINHYAYTTRPHAFEDFFPCCRYHSTSPESMFTQKRLCTLFLPDGRITLSDLRLITTRRGIREERSLSGEGEFRRVLKEQFNVELEP